MTVSVTEEESREYACTVCNKSVLDGQAQYIITGNHYDCQFKGRRKLTDFERGVFWSVYVMQKNTGQAGAAAQVIREAGFATRDCFELPAPVKTVLRVVNLESGMALAGLDE